MKNENENLTFLSVVRVLSVLVILFGIIFELITHADTGLIIINIGVLVMLLIDLYSDARRIL